MVMKIEESTKSKNEKIEDKSAELGVYPSSMRENFERMQSCDALNIDDLRGKHPDKSFRYINQKWRAKEGRTGGWYPVQKDKDRPVGDLTLAFMPKDLSDKRNEKIREKAERGLRGEREKQIELCEKINQDSKGTVTFTVGGNKIQKPPSTKKHFFT
jgi:hypothetical protein